MRPDSPTPRARRAGLIAVAVVAAAFALTACSGARPSTSVGEVVDSPVPAAAAPIAPSVTPPVATTAPATTIAPSGDVELDKLDADLSAFEHENGGLDQAAAATQEK